MHRSKSRFSRRAIIIAVAAFVALIVGGSVAYATVTSDPGRPTVGRDANNNRHYCITNGVMKVNPLLVDSKCPVGTYGETVPGLTYGIGLVNITRGTTTATWAKYSTTLGSPAGDTASGTFRFTCSDAQAPCKVSLGAFATRAGVLVYPRIDIMAQSLNGGAETYCEYADGSDNDGAVHSVGQSATNPTPIPLGIGGSLDCGSTQTYPSDGVVTSIWTPAGHFDVATTLTFTTVN